MARYGNWHGDNRYDDDKGGDNRHGGNRYGDDKDGDNRHGCDPGNVDVDEGETAGGAAVGPIQ